MIGILRKIFEYYWEKWRKSRKVTVEIVSATVTGKTRKLKASWTVETAEDLEILHGVNIADEIEDMMKNGRI